MGVPITNGFSDLTAARGAFAEPPCYTDAMEKALQDPLKAPRAKLPTRFGEFEIFGFESEQDGEQAVAIVKGPFRSTSGANQASREAAPLVRIHSQCLTGDILHSLRCDCGDQLELALERIEAAGRGILIYQMQEGRGIGLLNKLRAYQLQDQGIDTVDANFQLGFEADHRSYGFCARILKSFGVAKVRLMSNNPDKINGLQAHGIEVVERVPLLIEPSPISEGYLRTKKEKMGHLLD